MTYLLSLTKRIMYFFFSYFTSLNVNSMHGPTRSGIEEWTSCTQRCFKFLKNSRVSPHMTAQDCPIKKFINVNISERKIDVNIIKNCIFQHTGI